MQWLFAELGRRAVPEEEVTDLRAALSRPLLHPQLTRASLVFDMWQAFVKLSGRGGVLPAPTRADLKPFERAHLDLHIGRARRDRQRSVVALQWWLALATDSRARRAVIAAGAQTQ